MKSVIILRGISGSGKSSVARELMRRQVGTIICSADTYFETDAGYVFDKKRIGDAHRACLRTFVDALYAAAPLVVVDNTNTEAWEYDQYVKIADMAGYGVVFQEFVPPADPVALEDYVVKCATRNLHSVGYTVCMAQAKRFTPRAQ